MFFLWIAGDLWFLIALVVQHLRRSRRRWRHCVLVRSLLGRDNSQGRHDSLFIHMLFFNKVVPQVEEPNGIVDAILLKDFTERDVRFFAVNNAFVALPAFLYGGGCRFVMVFSFGHKNPRSPDSDKLVAPAHAPQDEAKRRWRVGHQSIQPATRVIPWKSICGRTFPCTCFVILVADHLTIFVADLIEVTVCVDAFRFALIVTFGFFFLAGVCALNVGLYFTLKFACTESENRE